MSIWECLKFDPATWKENTKKLTPKIVTKSTLSPKMKKNVEITVPWENAPRNENKIPSRGCVLYTVIGFKVSAE